LIKIISIDNIYFTLSYCMKLYCYQVNLWSLLSPSIRMMRLWFTFESCQFSS